MSWTHNRVLMDGERIDAGFEYFSTLLPLNGQIKFFVHRLATGHRTITRWASRLFVNGIRVPPMTSTWLQMHEIERGKHAPDL